ncbi:MAG: DUF116 domain-containing protein [Candidatus Micrarchaeota archaeon]
MENNGAKSLGKALKDDTEAVKHMIRSLVARTVSIGANASVSDIASKIANDAGVMSDTWVNYTMVELTNSLNRDMFKKIPKNERIVFIPHCLRNIKECKAVMDEEGVHCLKCGKCKIGGIVAECEKNGSKWFVVGGGSQVFILVKKYKPRAVVGIACYNELKLAIEKFAEIKIPGQVVLLGKTGCVNTDVEIKDVKEKLEME